jgi:uncharacterized membrane protein SpoIIM required for sporulation
MRQQAFETNNEQSWRQLEQTVAEIENGNPHADVASVPARFQKVCNDLALAQQRMYGRALCERLNRIIIATYGLLHKASAQTAVKALRFAIVTFPASVRREWRLFWLNMALFWLPMFAFIAAAQYDPRWIFTLVTPDMQQQMDAMYSASAPIEALREQYGSDFMMWAFYIQNNVSIGFRIFAGGVLFTLGAIFFVGFNGLLIGAVTGYIHYAGHTENFYRFVVGHSSLELIGLIICGAAGMRLGLALLKPGRLTRRDAMREAGKRALPLLYGGSVMIFLAAFVEGFWSASHAPAGAKYTVGIGLWVLLTTYLLFSGRRSNDAA